MNSFLAFLFNHARSLRDFILNLLFPIECLGCSQEDVWLCDKCFRKIPFNPFNYCLNCKKRNKYGEFCTDCSPNFYLNGVWIAGNYNNYIIVNLIKNLKYYYAKNLADILGKYLSLFLQNLLNKNRLTNINLQQSKIWRQLDKAKQSPLTILNFNQTIIIPVPLHKKRYLIRGFNQAEKLAQIVSKNFNLKINHDLIRIKHKTAQAKLNEKARKHNIKDCFVYRGENLINKNILLIDDVLTTGSTLNECAKVLKENNASEVWGLVVAKG